MNKIKNQFRQGDVLLQGIADLPASAVKQRVKGRVILAHGEVTGHHHSVDSRRADWWKAGDEQFVEIKHSTELVHQEHAAIQLPPDKYRVVRQREYSPEEIRNVAD